MSAGSASRRSAQPSSAYEATHPADVLVTLGDNDYTRGASFATNWTSTFGWLSSAGVGVAGTLGNHDVEVDRGRYEFDLLGMPAPYYVRRVKDVQLIVLDSNAITTAQTRWLKRVLAKRIAVEADRRLPPSAVHLRRPSRHRRPCSVPGFRCSSATASGSS